jgi:hypothetical protein
MCWLMLISCSAKSPTFCCIFQFSCPFDKKQWRGGRRALLNVVIASPIWSRWRVAELRGILGACTVPSGCHVTWIVWQTQVSPENEFCSLFNSLVHFVFCKHGTIAHVLQDFPLIIRKSQKKDITKMSSLGCILAICCTVFINNSDHFSCYAFCLNYQPHVPPADVPNM